MLFCQGLWAEPQIFVGMFPPALKPSAMGGHFLIAVTDQDSPNIFTADIYDFYPETDSPIPQLLVEKTKFFNHYLASINDPQIKYLFLPLNKNYFDFNKISEILKQLALQSKLGNYNLLSNNCVTKVIEILNQSRLNIDPIPLGWTPDFVENAAILNRYPASFIRYLTKHKLATGPAQIFSANQISSLKYFKVHDSAKNWVHCQNYQPISATVLTKAIGQSAKASDDSSLRFADSVFDFLKTSKSECHESKRKLLLDYFSMTPSSNKPLRRKINQALAESHR